MRGKTAKRIRRGTLRACGVLGVTEQVKYKDARVLNKQKTTSMLRTCTEDSIRRMYLSAKRNYKQIRKSGVAVEG